MKKLRLQHARAYSAWVSTRSHRWAAEVSRLACEINIFSSLFTAPPMFMFGRAKRNEVH